MADPLAQAFAKALTQQGESIWREAIKQRPVGHGALRLYCLCGTLTPASLPVCIGCHMPPNFALAPHT